MDHIPVDLKRKRIIYKKGKYHDVGFTDNGLGLLSALISKMMVLFKKN